jgi:hypothetical protein
VATPLQHYLTTWLVAITMTTQAIDSTTLRSILFSVFIIINTAEFMVAFTRIKPILSSLVCRSAWIVTVTFSLLHVSRIALLLTTARGLARLTDNQFVNVYTFIFTSFFAILWAGLILLIDVADLFGQLGRRNRTLEELATSDQLTGLNNRDLVQKSLELASRVNAGDCSAAQLFDFLVDQVVVGHMIKADSVFFEYTKGR